jgi:hypothetical protein
LFDTIFLFELEFYVLESNRHFTPELSVCALDDLTVSKLAYTARLLEWQRSTLFGLYENFFYLFIFSPWVQGLLVLGYCPTPYVTLWVLKVAHAFQELAKQTTIFFVDCS